MRSEREIKARLKQNLKRVKELSASIDKENGLSLNAGISMDVRGAIVNENEILNWVLDKQIKK